MIRLIMVFVMATVVGGGVFYGVWWLTQVGAAKQAHADAPVIAKAQVAAGQAAITAKATISQAQLNNMAAQVATQVQQDQHAIAMDSDGQTQMVPADVDAQWRAAIGRMPDATPGGATPGHPVRGPTGR